MTAAADQALHLVQAHSADCDTCRHVGKQSSFEVDDLCSRGAKLWEAYCETQNYPNDERCGVCSYTLAAHQEQDPARRRFGMCERGLKVKA